jgi:hypothetical protein
MWIDLLIAKKDQDSVSQLILPGSRRNQGFDEIALTADGNVYLTLQRLTGNEPINFKFLQE